MGYSSAQAREFINHIAPIMQKEAFERGYNIVSTAIAQAIIEGAAGTSKLARLYHNHFGMKAGQAWIKAGKPVVNMKTYEEYTVGNLTMITDGFRAYSDDVDGVKGYYDFISARRYQNLKTAPSYQAYAQYLKNDGYATSSTYVNTLINTVRKYDLEKWDRKNEVSYYPQYDGSEVRIDEIFRLIGVPEQYIGNVKNRTLIANVNGISTYTGSASQNTLLTELARNGQLKRV